MNQMQSDEPRTESMTTSQIIIGSQNGCTMFQFLTTDYANYPSRNDADKLQLFILKDNLALILPVVYFLHWRHGL